jgi:catechol 2,3-dioxygenase-like lactoylglutathione lyase family enzyme
VLEEFSEGIWHLGFVVRDVEKTAKRLEGILGISSWTIRVIEPESATFHGKEVSNTFKIAMGDFGNQRIELLQPVKGKSVYAEHLKKSREGFHHIAIRIPQDRLNEVIEKLEGQGGEVVQTGRVGAGPGYYYIDMKEMGLVIELNPIK